MITINSQQLITHLSRLEVRYSSRYTTVHLKQQRWLVIYNYSVLVVFMMLMSTEGTGARGKAPLNTIAFGRWRIKTSIETSYEDSI